MKPLILMTKCLKSINLTFSRNIVSIWKLIGPGYAASLMSRIYFAFFRE